MSDPRGRLDQYTKAGGSFNMARLNHSGTALGRKLYRENTSILIAPVSKGTWTVAGQTGQGRDRRTFKYTGVTDLLEIPELVELGLEDLLEQ